MADDETKPAPTAIVAVRNELWDRRDDEDEADWLAFRDFRDGPKPRVIGRGQRRFSGPGGHDAALALAAKNEWQLRAKAYDRHLDFLVQDEREKVVRRASREVTEDLLVLAHISRKMVTSQVRKKLELDAQSTLPEEGLKTTDLVRAVEIQVKTDRLIQGEATERIEEVSGPDYSALTIEELQTMTEIQRKIVLKKEGGS